MEYEWAALTLTCLLFRFLIREKTSTWLATLLPSPPPRQRGALSITKNFVIQADAFRGCHLRLPISTISDIQRLVTSMFVQSIRQIGSVWHDYYVTIWGNLVSLWKRGCIQRGELYWTSMEHFSRVTWRVEISNSFISRWNFCSMASYSKLFYLFSF